MIERPLGRFAGMAAVVFVASLLWAACSDDPVGPRVATLQVVGEANRARVVGAVETVEFRAVDAAGAGVRGVSLALSADAGSLSSAQVITGPDGSATVQWTLGTAAGEQQLTATASGVPPATVRVQAAPGAPGAITVSHLVLSFSALGDQQQLTTTVRDIHGNLIGDAEVTWASDDDAVATVAAGLVTAAGAGSTTVRASVGAVSAAISVSVQQQAGQIAISAPVTQLRALGHTVQLSAQVLDVGGSPMPGAQVDWTTLDAAIAGVTPGGLVEARAEGTARIVAAAGGVADTITITVLQVPAAVMVSPPDVTVSIGETVNFSAQAVDSAGQAIARASFTWGSSQPGVASINTAGAATAHAGGVATITATFESVQGTARLAVDIEQSPLLLAAGHEHTFFIVGSSLVGMGDMRRGQLTSWSMDPQLTPAQMDAADFVQVDAGDYFSIAMRADGSVWTWGLNDRSQLGYTTTEECDVGFGTNPLVPCSTVPQQVTLPLPATKVAAGRDHGMALLTDSTVWAWGRNSFGQVGNDGTTADVPAPVQVHVITRVIDIDGGGQFALAATADGRMWAWGASSSTSPAVCDGTAPRNHFVPVRIPNITDVVAVSGGWFTSRALRRDGTVWGCGGNNFGQVGSGNESGSVFVMEQVQGLTNVMGLSSGGYHGIALRDDGTVWTWGWNSQNRLGWDAGTLSRVPGQVPVSDIMAIRGGMGHSAVLDNAGRVWTWGRNLSGQLGDGTQDDRLEPQVVWPE
jgi:alpha-tubulin suppressor-like RCC1 family protein